MEGAIKKLFEGSPYLGYLELTEPINLSRISFSKRYGILEVEGIWDELLDTKVMRSSLLSACDLVTQSRS